MNELTVLMYHATYADSAELAAIDAADRPYAVSLKNFAAQIDALQSAGYTIVSQSQIESGLEGIERPLQLTFDDGHRSNALQVAPILAERGLSGLFFLTSDFCRDREDFCGEHDLKQMIVQGMDLGTHGKSHRFLSDLDDEQSHAELLEPKLWLSGIVEQEIDTLSFPGGRYGPRELKTAQSLGYRWVHDSNFGLHRLNSRDKFHVVPRIPVRQQHSCEDLLALINPKTSQFKRTRATTVAKTALKRVIGNEAYDALYRRLAS